MNETHILELRVVGQDLEPGSVRSKEIAELLDALEDAVASVVVVADPSFSKEQVIVGVTSIGRGSISLHFDSPTRPSVLAGFRQVSEAISSSAFRRLPNSARRSLSKMSAFTRRHDCRAEFREATVIRPLAVIDKTTQVAEPELVYGETSLYGKIIRVGGRSPRVMVETVSGESIFCDASPRLAKDLAPRLYESVRLQGRAGWDPDDWSLVEFRILDADAGPDLSPSSVMRELSEAIGAYFAGPEDVTLMSRRIRTGEDH